MLILGSISVFVTVHKTQHVKTHFTGGRLLPSGRDTHTQQHTQPHTPTPTQHPPTHTHTHPNTHTHKTTTNPIELFIPPPPSLLPPAAAPDPRAWLDPRRG